MEIPHPQDEFDLEAFEAALSRQRAEDDAYRAGQNVGWTLVDGDYVCVSRSVFPQAPTGPGDADRYLQAWAAAEQAGSDAFPPESVADAMAVAVYRRRYAAAPHRAV